MRDFPCRNDNFKKCYYVDVTSHKIVYQWRYVLSKRKENGGGGGGGVGGGGWGGGGVAPPHLPMTII